MDVVVIDRFKIPVKIGWQEPERLKPQMLELSFRISISNNKAAKTKDLKDTVCYRTLTEQITSFISENRWILVEELAEDLVKLTFENHPAAKKVFVRVKKFVLPNTEWVGFEIERERIN